MKKYTRNDIKKIPLTDFMAALGEKPVQTYDELKLYHVPYRHDREAVFVVDTQTNRWYDHETKKSGKIVDLARLKMIPELDTDPKEFIVRTMNDYEHVKVLKEMSRCPVKPLIIDIDINRVRLTDFMTAIGYEHPVSADGSLLLYKAPYDPKHEPTMIINTDTNRWHDTQSEAKGDIYALAYELTGSCSISELNFYIAGHMGVFDKDKEEHGHKSTPDPPGQEPDKPNRRMHP